MAMLMSVLIVLGMICGWSTGQTNRYSTIWLMQNETAGRMDSIGPTALMASLYTTNVLVKSMLSSILVPVGETATIAWSIAASYILSKIALTNVFPWYFSNAFGSPIRDEVPAARTTAAITGASCGLAAPPLDCV